MEKARTTDTCACGVGKTRTESLTVKGRIRAEVWRNGKLVDVREADNLIVNAGKAHLAGLLVGASGYSPFRYVAVGTGTTTPSADDTALEQEITGGGLARGEGTISVNGNVATITKTWNVTDTYGITEVGLFNASSGGTMYARATFAVVNVENGDTFTFTWQITMI